MNTMTRAYPNRRDGAKPLTTWGLVLVLTMLMAPTPSCAEQSRALAAEFPQAAGGEDANAQEAADAADRLRAAFEERYSWHPSSTVKPSSEEARADAEKVIAAYTLVADSFPHTEIAARSGIRLSGFYQYLGRTAQAVEKAREVAADCQDTPYAPQAILAVGLLYSQAAPNHAAAIEWLSKIPRPHTDSVITEDLYDEQEKLYLAAQRQIAHCDLVLGRGGAARERFDRLAERYPMYQDDLRRECEVQLETAGHPVVRLVDEIIEQSVGNLETTAVSSVPVNNVTESPSPIGSPRPAPAADAPVVLSDTRSTGRLWAGWSLSVLGTVLCAAGIMYSLRMQGNTGT